MKINYCTMIHYNLQCLNTLLTIITYSIFKENSFYKFSNTNKSYANVDLKQVVKENLLYYNIIVNEMDNNNIGCYVDILRK